MKRLKITVDGTPYDVTVEEISDTPVSTTAPTTQPPVSAPTQPTPPPAVSKPAPAPAAQQGSGAAGDLTSPLAGTVLKVDVTVGQAVNAGDPVARLEAMKMESVLTAPTTGTVKAIHVHDGDTVQEGTLLLTIG